MSMYSEIIKSKQKEWNCDDLMTAVVNKTHKRRIPFSSPLMSYATYGGIETSTLTELYGNPSGGKSTTAIDLCKNAIDLFQQEYDEKEAKLRDEISGGNKKKSIELEELQDTGPRRVLYIDLEHSFDKQWGEKLGVDFDKLDIMSPPNIHAEAILNTVLEIMDSGECGLIVLDSIPSLVPKAELDKQLGERTVSALAGLLTIFCRKAIPIMSEKDVTLIVINQTRDNMDNPYVTSVPGGRALKFYSSLRIEFNIGNPVDFLGNELPKSADNPSGYLIQAKVVKQKTAPFDRKLASYYLMMNQGIVPEMDFANLAIKKYGLIKKAAGWFTFCNPATGEILEENGKIVKVNGMARVFQYLKDNPDYYSALKEKIMSDIEGRDPNFVGNMLSSDSPNLSDDNRLSVDNLDTDDDGVPVFEA